jgi:cytidylate kinase
MTLQEVLEAQNKRDAQDEARDVGPLVKAPDAIEVITDGMSVDQVVDRLVELARRRADSDNPG